MNVIKYNKAFEYFCKTEKKMKWAFDNKITNTKRLEVDWETLVVWLVSGHVVSNDHKFEQPMLSITTYRESHEAEEFIYKRADNVISQDAIVLDYDDGTTIDQFKELYGQYEWVAYTTFSNSEQLMKFRVILPLDTPISVDEIKERTAGFHKEFPTADPSSFDVGRSFFIPSCPTDHEDIADSWWNEGKLFSWKTVEVQEMPEITMREVKRTGVSGKDKKGKILYDTLDVVGFFKEVGLYKRSVGGGKHEVGCPWHSQHSSSPDTGTAIWEEGSNGAPVFYCVHQQSHGRKTLFDVTKWAREAYDDEFMRQFYEVEPYSKEVTKKIDAIEQTILELKGELT